MEGGLMMSKIEMILRKRAQVRINRRGIATMGTDIFTNTSFAEELEELELTEGSKTEHGMVKGGDLLDSDLATTRSVHSRAYDAIRSFAYDVEYLILGTWDGKHEGRVGENRVRSQRARRPFTDVEPDFSGCRLCL
jgi:hypothetical protein